MRLRDKVAIITGAGQGIGEAYARRFATEGARVVVADVNAEKGATVARDIGAVFEHVDVASEEDTRRLARAVVGRFGRIDVLINNAAVFATIPISRVPLDEINVEEWDRVMAVNLRGVFLACKAVLPAMKARGSGRIINIASGTVFSGPATRIHYVTSKAGVLGFTRTLAREVGAQGITVNTIAPGSTLSEERPTEEMMRFRQSAIQGRAIPRLQVPDDLVGAVIFFASDESAFVTGQTLVVDGGNVMH